MLSIFEKGTLLGFAVFCLFALYMIFWGESNFQESPGKHSVVEVHTPHGVKLEEVVEGTLLKKDELQRSFRGRKRKFFDGGRYFTQ